MPITFVPHRFPLNSMQAKKKQRRDERDMSLETLKALKMRDD
jgi:hypothetical protein